MARKQILVVVVVALMVLALAACGHRRTQVTQLSLTPLAQHEQDDSEQMGDDSGVLPPVMALDGCISVSRSVSEDETITSQGWEAYRDGQTGTNGTSGLNVETEGTALTLRAYAAGEYAYAVYGQAIGAAPKPLKSLIDCDPCAFGGGQDDDIPLSYFVGIADYSIGSWRWFGPFGDVDVMITVNSETLKSRFKSPADNFYLCVLASNGSKAASSLPDEGLIADFPIELRARAVSAEGDDPGGLTIEEICTWVEENLLTDPAIVTGLSASSDTEGVSLTWDTNLDPDVYIYQVLRDDLDDEEPPLLLAGVNAPEVTYADATGIPGKEYQYAVRARNDAGFGGRSYVDAVRELEVPYLSATYGYYEDRIVVDWTEVEGAIGYRLYRAPNELDTPQLLSELPAETTGYEDTEPGLDERVWYWVQALGEDMEGPLGEPHVGFRGISKRGDWWMFGREPTQNRRSPYVGAQTGNLKWRYDMEGGESSPAIGADGTVYVGSGDSYLYAINVEGTLKWRYETGHYVHSSPAIGADSTIYVGSDDGYLYAINSDGTLEWRYQTGDLVRSSPAIGTDGTIYAGSDDGYLYAINSDGTLEWRYESGGQLYLCPAIGTDGTIYVGIGIQDYLYAINPEGTLRWRYYTVSSLASSPAIGSDGTVYVRSNDGFLYALNPDGTLRWRYETGGGWVESSPAIGADGTIYVGSQDNHLYAITDDETEGTLKWRYETGSYVRSSPAIGADGTIYVGSDDGYLYAITDSGAEGKLKWRYETGSGVDSSPAIGADGTIYVGSYDGYLYAFGD